MAPCEFCSNLWPETMNTLTEGQRAVMFVDLKDLKTSAARPEPCPECSLIWTAVSLFKTSWEHTNFNHSVELYICPGKPLRLNWHDDAIQLELFSGFQGIVEDVPKDVSMRVFGPTTYVSAHSSAPECFDLISSWLETCVKTHTTCTPRTLTELPTRLLRVGSAKDNTIALIETNGLLGQYIALSYCWGDYHKQSLKTTAQTLDSHKEGIKFESLSQTLQDAIIITRVLGIEYLWIDALCIIQGDQDDWAQESARMATVYLNAYLTISADNSPGCDKGIFNQQTYGVSDQKIPYRNGNYVSVRKAFGQEHLLHSLAIRGDFDTEPTRGRAWTLQETMLATRILRYTSKELVWECNESWNCECGGASGSKRAEWYTEAYIRNMTALATLPVETIHEQWRQILSCFTERSLTVETDRLPAISGLASQFAKSLQIASGSEMPDSYLAGMWRSDLAQSLCWGIEDDFFRTGRSFQLPYARSKIWRAPTWTWACIEGAVAYAPLANLTTCIDIVEATTTPSTIDKYGQVNSGKLVVKGKVMRGLLLEIQQRSPDDSNTGFSDGKRYALQYSGGLRTFSPDSCDDWTSCTIGLNAMSLTCLLIGIITEQRNMTGKEEVFLVLRPKVSLQPSTHEVYERVGVSIRASHETHLATIDGKRKESTEKFKVIRLFDTAPEEMITIV